MKYPPAAERVCTRIEQSESSGAAHLRPGAAVSLLTPLDPLRQAKRLPIRVIKMLTAHTGHLLHPDYLQPLTSAPVSIEVGYLVVVVCFVFLNVIFFFINIAAIFYLAQMLRLLLQHFQTAVLNPRAQEVEI